MAGEDGEGGAKDTKVGDRKRARWRCERRGTGLETCTIKGESTEGEK